FRRGYSTVDHIHAVRQLVEKCNEFQIPLCLAFVDYKKAFDSVERNALLNALDKCGVNPNYVDLLTEMTTGCSTEIKLFSDPCYIDICKGVRQGDTIFPKLFAVTLETLFSELDWDCGIRVDGERLTHLLFADDCVLFAHSGPELQDKLLQLQIESKKIGLEMNLAKTKWMRNSLCRESRINIEGQIIQEVGSYVYLGQQLS
ncbi:Retrovirus-related Pol polyprotein from type-1 retrotransposable element R2, partial [Toxocara canis]